MKLTAQALLIVKVNRDELAEELRHVETSAFSFKSEEVNMLLHRLVQLDAIIRKQCIIH